MARYYFDVQNGKSSVRDDEGAEFDSLEAAVQAAARSAAEIGTKPVGERRYQRCRHRGARRAEPAGLQGNRVDEDRAARPIPSGAAFLERVSSEGPSWNALMRTSIKELYKSAQAGDRHRREGQLGRIGNQSRASYVLFAV